MNNMNDCTTMIEHVKMKVAEVLSNALVYQGEQAVKFSFWFFISEPETPIELLQEDAK